MLREIFTAGADLHSISQHRQSPLMSILEGFFWYNELSSNSCRLVSRLVPIILQMWLEDLRDSGVDLLEYGRAEKCLLESGVLDQNLSYREWSSESNEWYDYSWRLISFTYGANPQDWFLWESCIYDSALGEFWAMVENTDSLESENLHRIPGAWCE